MMSVEEAIAKREAHIKAIQIFILDAINKRDPSGVGLALVWDLATEVERDGAIVSRALCDLMSSGRLQMGIRPETGTRYFATKELPTPWQTGYAAGFKAGGTAIARDVNAVLDGYDFAGNALAKAVCEEYRDMIRARLASAIEEKSA